MREATPVTPRMLDSLQHWIECCWTLWAYCDHTHRSTRNWLHAHLPEDEVEPTLAYLVQLGGKCDCEVYTKLRAEDLSEGLASDE